MSLAFDEYGRPFIIVRDQGEKTRLKGTLAAERRWLFAGRSARARMAPPRARLAPIASRGRSLDRSMRSLDRSCAPWTDPLDVR